MRITLVSGADGASFVHSLAVALDPSDELTVVAPVVGDHWSAWLKACPDLDGLLAPSGRATTFAVADELRAIDYSPAWHRTSDQAVASRLVRTELIGTGYSLSEATLAAAARAGLPYRLLPMSDDRAELRVVVEGGADAEGQHAMPLGEYLADPASHVPTETVLVAEAWTVSSSVVEQLGRTDVVVLGPSSRTLAIDPVLRTPGLLDALPASMPVLVVAHDDPAPADLVRVAGLRADDPGIPQLLEVGVTAADVVAAARRTVES